MCSYFIVHDGPGFCFVFNVLQSSLLPCISNLEEAGKWACTLWRLVSEYTYARFKQIHLHLQDQLTGYDFCAVRAELWMYT